MTLTHILVFAALLFGMGMAGIIMNRKNVIILLMSIELMLLGVNTNFIAYDHFLPNKLTGQVFVFFILTVAAAEAAIGLAIMVLLFRKTKTIEVDRLTRLKG